MGIMRTEKLTTKNTIKETALNEMMVSGVDREIKRESENRVLPMRYGRNR